MNLANEHLTRSIDLLPLECLSQKITIIGAGAVGGWTALALAKMGFSNLTVWDHDKVEAVNAGSQIYGVNHRGTYKVHTLKTIIEKLANVSIEAVCDKYTAGHFPGIVISAVDSMEVRTQIFVEHMGRPFTKWVIDPRMAAEVGILYVVCPNSVNDQASYRKTLHSDENSVHEPCTRKATAYCAMGLAAVVASQVKALATGQPYRKQTQWDMPKGAMQSWGSVG